MIKSTVTDRVSFMKRLHVHVSVKDLSASIRFYRTLFAAEPVVTKPDYAKWMLEDPARELCDLDASPTGGRQSLRVPGGER